MVSQSNLSTPWRRRAGSNDRALADGPQTITRKGQKAVVVVSAEEWQRKTKRKGNLAEFFASSPLRGSDLRIKRSKDGPRAIEL